MPHFAHGSSRLMAECLSQTKWRGGKRAGNEEEAGGRRALGIEPQREGGTIFWAGGGPLCSRRKGIVHMRMKTCTLTACLMFAACGREGTHGLSKRDAACGWTRRPCGMQRKRIEVLDRAKFWARRAEQEDPGNALPGYVRRPIAWSTDRPKDDKHPVLLPIGETAQFRIHKDKLILESGRRRGRIRSGNISWYP